MAEDSRVIRTKKAIKDGFIQLLGSKDLDSITVKDIAETAQVDRKTVYNYYPGVYALIDEIEDDFTKRATEQAKLIQKNNFLFNPQSFTALIQDDIIENLKKYRVFLNAQDGSNLLFKFENIIEKIIENGLISSLNEAGIDYSQAKIKLCAAFVTYGLIGSCRNCLTRLEDAPERFIENVVTIASYGIGGGLLGIPEKNIDK